MDNNNKRSISETSPEESHHHKKRIMSETADVFSWATFDTKMEKYLENVAKKEDVIELQRNLNDVKQENAALRHDVEQLKAKIEMLDKNMRRSNVIFSGIKCTSVAAAKSNIINICKKTLNVKVNIVRTVMLKSNYEFLVELETTQQAINIIMKGSKLKDSGIYVQRDFTADDREKRYELRKLKNVLKKVDETILCKFKNVSLVVNDKQYDWCDGDVVARSQDDKDSLMAHLEKADTLYNVVVKQRPRPEAGANSQSGDE